MITHFLFPEKERDSLLWLRALAGNVLIPHPISLLIADFLRRAVIRIHMYLGEYCMAFFFFCQGPHSFEIVDASSV